MNEPSEYLSATSPRSKSRPAHAFLQEHQDDRFFITFTISGELACGDSAATETDWRLLVAPYGMLDWRPDVSLTYGRLYRHLKQRGAMFGTNDLWIAATARSYGMAVVTRNAAEFKRIPELVVLSF